MTIRRKVQCAIFLSALILVGAVAMAFVTLQAVRDTGAASREIAATRSVVQDIATLSARLMDGQAVEAELRAQLDACARRVGTGPDALSSSWQAYERPTRQVFELATAVQSRFNASVDQLAPWLCRCARRSKTRYRQPAQQHLQVPLRA